MAEDPLTSSADQRGVPPGISVARLPSREPTPSLEYQARLACERTALAYERTFAAWIRTGLAALAFGIALRSLAGTAPGWLLKLSESALILFSALCFAAGVRRERSSVEGPRHAIVFLRLLPVMSCVLLVAALAALIDVWIGGAMPLEVKR